MNESKLRELLSEVLDCGLYDLDVLLESKYEYHELVDYARMNGEPVCLNGLTDAMFSLAIDELQTQLDRKLEEFKETITEPQIMQQYEYTEDDINDLRAIMDSDSLDLRDDVEMYLNYTDVTVSIVNNTDVYMTFFEDIIEKFEELTGYMLVS